MYKRVAVNLGLITLTTLVITGCEGLGWGSKTVKVTGTRGGGEEGVVVPNASEASCIVPPETFLESDLIGTWAAGPDHRRDTIILAEGGLYRQILDIEQPQYSYESNWQRWWIEYPENGPPYLHLEGMRLCVYRLTSDCNSSAESVARWYDFCRDQIVETHNEGVLLIMGVASQFEQPSRGIELVPLVKDPDSGGWVYQLQQ